MNDNQFEILKEYENYFYTAVKANYIRSISSTDISKIESVGLELAQGKITNKNCPQCVFNYVKKIGILYFEYKNRPQENLTPDQVKTAPASKTPADTKKAPQTKKKAPSKQNKKK